MTKKKLTPKQHAKLEQMTSSTLRMYEYYAHLGFDAAYELACAAYSNDKLYRDLKAQSSWRKQMEEAGWQPIRDIFGCLVRYEYEQPDGKPLVLEAAHFSMWANLRQTPPPF